MIVQLKVPSMGESVSEVEVGAWHRSVGDAVTQDELVVEIESEKASIELPAPETGVLRAIYKQTGQSATIGEVIGEIDTDAAAARVAPAARATPAAQARAAAAPAPAPQAQGDAETADGTQRAGTVAHVMPAARVALEQAGLEPGQVTPTGPGGRLLKEDVLRAAGERARPAPAASPEPRPPAPPASPQPAAQPAPAAPGVFTRQQAPATQPSRGERRLRMSMMRRTIAARLLEAQQAAALLTTFNEIDMSEVLLVRREFGDRFRERYGVKLGLMSFFVVAAVASLQQIPEVNASIEDEEIVYHDYCDIGIAIGSGKGLVVPVLRNAEALDFAEIERKIADYAARAKAGTLGMDELRGGTFSISNGGIYGSLLSTPIVNPPQSAILGLHLIAERPVVRDGQVVIRPVMNVALTYDHRLIDGREAVTFLKSVKQRVEHPASLLLGA
jgi:2-oxoglutarate dehydrogenase E2 component (dihydrolipoamide succinyltransferase)